MTSASMSTQTWSAKEDAGGHLKSRYCSPNACQADTEAADLQLALATLCLGLLFPWNRPFPRHVGYLAGDFYIENHSWSYREGM